MKEENSEKEVQQNAIFQQLGQAFCFGAIRFVGRAAGAGVVVLLVIDAEHAGGRRNCEQGRDQENSSVAKLVACPSDEYGRKDIAAGIESLILPKLPVEAYVADNAESDRGDCWH